MITGLHSLLVLAVRHTHGAGQQLPAALPRMVHAVRSFTLRQVIGECPVHAAAGPAVSR